MRVLIALLGVLAVVGVFVIGSGPPAGAAPGDDGSETGEFLRISLDAIDPSAVTTTSPGTVTARGTLTNVGDRPVNNIAMRLQRAPQVTTSEGLGDSLSADANSFDVVGAFQDISEQLAPGKSLPFTLRINLSDNSSGDPSLQIDRPGVYPILINVNGTPDYGVPARLDDSRTLLPVMGLPADRDRARTAEQSADPLTSPIGGDGSIPPDTSAPVGLTMLWPIAAPASLAPGVTGGGDETVRLMDNGLQQSISPGGRLDNLLMAMEQVHADDPDSQLSRSLCLAVDPDLLISVQSMTEPYLVSTDPGDPTGPAREGTGTPDAIAFLDRLSALAGQTCVVATSFAHVDTAALTRVADKDLSEIGLRAPADIVDNILGVKSVRGLAIPPSGVLDDASADLVRDTLSTGAIVSASGIDNSAPTSPDGTYPLGDDLAVQTYDPALASALAALGTTPHSAQVTPNAQRAGWVRGSEQARRQTAIASLMFTALEPSASAATPQQLATPAPADPIADRIGRGEVLIAPPTWSATPEDTKSVLSAMTMLLGSDLAVARPLPGITEELTTIASTPAGAGLVAPRATQIAGPSPQAIAAVRSSSSAISQLQDSMTTRSDVPITPAAYMAPLREDLLRAMASVSPQDQDAAARAASMRTSAVSITVASISDGVGILDPGGRFTLASERSPLLLVIRNDLPVAMRARLNITVPEGMTVGDLGVIEIPPNGTRQIEIPTRADRSRSMTVEIGLVTTNGVPLGDPINLSVHSNAYGKPLFIITICAGVLLVFLAGRRLWHRFRGEPDPADLDRPEPDERDRLMADSRALHSPPERGGHHPDGGHR
ncbi:hypothetical protein DFR67_104288 [Williamsia limnetica]|uniref:Glycoprotein n=2 Tax=Williamsia limnetica TaxID=882452 RepID=A0A318RQK0_WILLI|nr:hypothetical protein DFR67_104288 [Williamsia limnetica]